MGVVLLKLGVSAILGIVLGLEREMKHKPLGLKTCLVISVTSCLLTIVSIESAQHANVGSALMRADPMRLAAQIVSGIGFLGAGVILRRSNEVISGLTTAAIVWSASGLGIATGAGYYWQATCGVILIIVSVELVPAVVRRLGPKALRDKEVLIKVHVAHSFEVRDVLQEMENRGYVVDNMKIRGGEDGHILEMSCMIPIDTSGIADIYDQIRGLEMVHGVEIEVL